MSTDTLVSTVRITESRDLRPGDIITQGYLDVEKGEQISVERDVRLDRVFSAYLVYVHEGQSYLVPVVMLHGWDVRRGRGVKIACSPSRPWETLRAG